MKNIGIALDPETADLEINVIRAAGKIITGLTIRDITPQNQAVLLQSHPGEIKEAPAVGCGISDMLLDNELLAWERKIRQQIENEGMKIKSFLITKDLIDIDANY